jgi:predicted membrane channel-forming protein YqfA (hemolysin III family)
MYYGDVHAKFFVEYFDNYKYFFLVEGAYATTRKISIDRILMYTFFHTSWVCTLAYIIFVCHNYSCTRIIHAMVYTTNMLTPGVHMWGPFTRGV